MPAPGSDPQPPRTALEQQLLGVADILDKAIAAVNQAIDELRASDSPEQEGRTVDDI